MDGGGSVASEGAAAARWALARRRALAGGRQDEGGGRGSPWVIQGLEGDRPLGLVQPPLVADILLRAEAGRERYVPGFVVRELRDRRVAWSVATTRFVHSGTEVRMCVVGRRGDVTRGRHVGLADTVRFGLDCIAHAVARAVAAGTKDASPPAGRAMIHVTCVLCGTRRTLPPRPGQVVGMDAVNAGVTYLQHDTILVYRRQHVHKVLLHELIHCVGLDAALRSSPAQRATEARLVRELGYVPETGAGDLRLHEAYVEVLACFWYACLAATPRDRLSVLRRREGRLFRDTCVQIRRHQGGGAPPHGPRPLREGTHVLAYFFAKSALWDRLDELPLLPTEAAGGARRFWSLVYDVLRPGSALWDAIRRAIPGRTPLPPSSRLIRMTGIPDTMEGRGDEGTRGRRGGT